ncbi:MULTISPECIES: hypothetical protein [Prevotella]|jgi:hypothetical protein|nr:MULTISPECIES: hypothetical protein [Prevotella]
MKKRLSAVVFTPLSYQEETKAGPYLSLKIKRLRIPAKPFV